MNSKLNEGEIRALRFIANHSAFDGALSDRLFTFSLPSRDQSDMTTKHGVRALFRYTCAAGLAAIAKGEQQELTIDAAKWLLKSGFIQRSADGKRKGNLDAGSPVAGLP